MGGTGARVTEKEGKSADLVVRHDPGLGRLVVLLATKQGNIHGPRDTCGNGIAKKSVDKQAENDARKIVRFVQNHRITHLTIPKKAIEDLEAFFGDKWRTATLSWGDGDEVDKKVTFKIGNVA